MSIINLFTKQSVIFWILPVQEKTVNVLILNNTIYKMYVEHHVIRNNKGLIFIKHIIETQSTKSHATVVAV